MVRTKENSARKAAGEKMPRKVEAQKSGIRSKGPGSSYKARPTPSWQKGIGDFFSKDEPSTSFAGSTKTYGDSHDNDSANAVQKDSSATVTSADETNGNEEESGGATGKEIGKATGCDDNGAIGEELNDNPSEDIAEGDAESVNEESDSDNRNFTLHLSTDDDD